jgi:hypothetical protein
MTKDEALKLALEALEYRGGSTWLKRGIAVEAIKEALAGPEQEPDYWLGYGLQAHTEKPFDDATPLYTTTPQRQLEERNFCSRCGKRLGLGGIHTCTPPPREW